jgi:branched-chain amino acid transport system ATP-binding protein
MSGEPILQVHEATKRYGGVVAVQAISFDVYKGEILGLIGPNGAGKTTLVNLITGVAKPTSGTIVFRGRQLNGLPPHTIGRMGIARTFQVVRPFLNLTVLENTAVGAMFGAGGRRRSTAEAFARAAEALDFVGLSRWKDDPADSLPIGYRKRLELARALAMDPDLLLLDEVMAGLRGAEVDQAIEIVRRIHERGITVLMIEHVMKVIMRLSQRVVVLDYGRKIAEGPPEQIINDPAVISAYLGKKYGKGSTADGQDAAGADTPALASGQGEQGS